MENMTPIDLIEHELFDGFFLEVVNEIEQERTNVLHACNGKATLKRSAYDVVRERGLLSVGTCAGARKKEIYACAQKRSRLSRRERDFFEHLTVRAGAKLIAHINQPKNETPTPE